MDQNDLYYIGKVIKTHGVKGEFKAKIEATEIKNYNKLKHIYYYKNEVLYQHVVEKFRDINPYCLIKLEGIDNIDDALSIKNYKLFIDDLEVTPLQTNEFFIHDLIDADLYSTTNLYLGKIINFFENGANGVCEVLKPNQTEHFLFPTTKEILKEIIPIEKKVIIELIPGLMDLTY